ncbi:MAG: DUF5305 family protein, partial [Dehalococcoidia bacterium]
VVCLLIGFILGVWSAFSAPTQREEEVTRLVYSQRGDFGYAAELSDNVLYGNVILTEEDTSLLFLSIVESLEGSFSYNFGSDQPLEQLSHRVELVAVVENPDNWSKTILLIPETVKTGSFTITFPIDTEQLFALIGTIEGEIGVTSGSHNLTIQASVRTTALTDYGPVNEFLTQSMSGTLQTNRLVWSSEPPLSQTRYGSLQDTVTIPIDRGSGTTWWPIALAFVVLLGSYVVWNYAQTRPVPVSAVEAEARQARKKHEDIIADVEEMPEAKIGEMVISLASLEELVKVGEVLLKPVFHKAEPRKHTYCVIDGPTRYQYVSQKPAA